MNEKNQHIIETMIVQCKSTKKLTVLQPFQLKHVYALEDILMHNSGAGNIYYMVQNQSNILLPGNFLLLPSRQPLTIAWCTPNAPCIDNQWFIDHYQAYLMPHNTAVKRSDIQPSVSFEYISFNTLFFDYFDCFRMLHILPMALSLSHLAQELFQCIFNEIVQKKLGTTTMVKSALEIIIIEILQKIDAQPLYANMITQKQYSISAQEKRLLAIFSYIKKNITNTLSNKELANVAHLSEDYVSQYFKAIVQENLQEYIVLERMKKAIALLQQTSLTIAQVSKEVGFHDVTYFSKRFKQLFGLPAKKIRKVEFPLLLKKEK